MLVELHVRISEPVHFLVSDHCGAHLSCTGGFHSMQESLFGMPQGDILVYA